MPTPQVGERVLFWRDAPSQTKPTGAQITRVLSNLWVALRCDNGDLVDLVAYRKSSQQSPLGNCCVPEVIK